METYTSTSASSSTDIKTSVENILDDPVAKSDQLFELETKAKSDINVIKEKAKPIIAATDVVYYSLVVDSQNVLEIIKDNIPELRTGFVNNGRITCTEPEILSGEDLAKKDAVDSLVDDIANIKIEEDDAFEGLFDKKKLVDGDNVVINEKNSVYKLIQDTHVTLLYTGKKLHEKEHEFAPFLSQNADAKADPSVVEEDISKTYDVIVNKIGYSDKFIVLGVTLPEEIPYYGNEIRHITVGLRQKKDKKFKAVPVNSPQALNEDKTPIILETPIIINGKINTVK